VAAPRVRSPADRRRGARAAVLALAASLLSGCGGGLAIGAFDCHDEIAHVTGLRGPPDTIERHVEAGLHVHTFWYWRSGLGITFIWGGDLPCERRDVILRPLA